MVDDSMTALVVEVNESGKSVRQSISDLSVELRDRGHALTGMVDKSFTTLTEELHEGTTGMLQRLEATHTAMVRLLGDPGSDEKSIADMLRVLQQASMAIQHSSERLTDMAPVLEEAMARQLDRQSRDLHETMHNYTGRLADSVGRQEKLQEEGFGRLERGLGAFGDTMLEVTQQHDAALFDQLRNEISTVRADLSTGTERLKEMGEATRGLADSARSLASADNVQRELVSNVAQATSRLTESMDQVIDRLERIAERLMDRSTIPAGSSVPYSVNPPPSFTYSSPGVEAPKRDASETSSPAADPPANGKAAFATPGFFSRLFRR
jgi:ABC-type transporter Mla subunit MlaD